MIPVQEEREDWLRVTKPARSPDQNPALDSYREAVGLGEWGVGKGKEGCTGRQGEPARRGPGALEDGGGVGRAWADEVGTKRAPAHLAASSPRPPTQIQSGAEAVIGGGAPSPTPLTS